VLNVGLTILNAENHRGEQAAGIAIFDGKQTRNYGGPGKVAEVFCAKDVRKWKKLTGFAMVGQVLYSTVGSGKEAEQPKIQQPMHFHFQGKRGYISYNGNMIRLGRLRQQARRAGYEFVSEISDTEVIAALLSTSKQKTFLEAMVETLKKLEGKGAFSLVILYQGKLYGARDQNGIRPLCIIKRSSRGGDADNYIFASESSVYPALEAARFVRSVDMGELVVMGQDGMEKSVTWTRNTRRAFCIAEFIYFANPATAFFDTPVYSFRVKAGEMSARCHPVDADAVVPVPDSGRGYSDGFSSQSQIPTRGWIVKSRYASRTFMSAREIDRSKQQRTKLQTPPRVMLGKRVCLVEDSVFRGSVAPPVVSMSRVHGLAKEVHLRVCSPPVCHGCHLGLDTEASGQLVASHMTPEEIRDKVVLSDSLEYLTIEELKNVLRELGLNPDDFCLGCFTGEYPVPPPKKK
jgi:amidophosphoribosyltransferase